MWILHPTLSTYHPGISVTWKKIRFEHCRLSIYNCSLNWPFVALISYWLKGLQGKWDVRCTTSRHTLYLLWQKSFCQMLKNPKFKLLSPIESVEHSLWLCSCISVERKFSLYSLIMMLCCINRPPIMQNQLDTLD